jgi:hypothetical protein
MKAQNVLFFILERHELHRSALSCSSEWYPKVGIENVRKKVVGKKKLFFFVCV